MSTAVSRPPEVRSKGTAKVLGVRLQFFLTCRSLILIMLSTRQRSLPDVSLLVPCFLLWSSNCSLISFSLRGSLCLMFVCLRVCFSLLGVCLNRLPWPNVLTSHQIAPLVKLHLVPRIVVHGWKCRHSLEKVASCAGCMDLRV